MYKLSYEKCVCFLFLVILVFLSCSGFHTDRLVTLTDHSNKKYPFTSSYSFNENAGLNSDEFIARLMNAEMETTAAVRKWYSRGASGGMHFAGVPGAGASLTEGVDQHYPPPPQYLRRRRHLTRRRKRRPSVEGQENHSNSINTKTHPVEDTRTTSTISTSIQAQEQQNQIHITANLTKLHEQTRTNPEIQGKVLQTEEHEESLALIREKRAAGRGNNRERRRRNDRKFCPGQDVGTRAFHAKIVIEGRVRSMRNPTESSSKTGNNGLISAVSVEVKKIHKNEGNETLNITDIIRLHFAFRKQKGCDQKLIHGLVPAQLDNGNYYIFYLKSLGAHNYTALGQPVPYDQKKVQQILDVVHRKKVKEAKIINLRYTNDFTKRPNEELKLICEVRGNPPPIVTWYKNGTKVRGKRNKLRINYKEKKSVLKIPKVDSSDAGNYECKAKGVIGRTISRSTFVPIHSENPEGSPVMCPSPQKEEFCLNGGTCYSYVSLGELACKCSNGFNGQRCENKDVTSQSSTYTRTVSCTLGRYYC